MKLDFSFFEWTALAYRILVALNCERTPHYAIYKHRAHDSRHIKDSLKDSFTQFLVSLVNHIFTCEGENSFTNRSVEFSCQCMIPSSDLSLAYQEML